MGEQIYIAQVTANALAAGRFVALTEGEPVTLSPEEAEDLLRIQFVARVNHNKRAGEPEGDAGRVQTAAMEPTERATAPAQQARTRKGSAGAGA